MIQRRISRSARDGVDWFVWRIVADPRIPDGLSQVSTWSCADLYEAHAVLDALDDMQALERSRPPPPPKTPRGHSTR